MEFFNCLMKVKDTGDMLENERIRDECYEFLAYAIRDIPVSFAEAENQRLIEACEIYRLSGNLSDCIGVRSLEGGSPNGTCIDVMGFLMERSEEIANRFSQAPCSAHVVTLFDNILSGGVPEYDDDITGSIIHYTPGVAGVTLEKREVGLSEPAPASEISMVAWEKPERPSETDNVLNAPRPRP